MCKQEKECEYKNDLRGCALKHISQARTFIAKGKYEEADNELDYAEKHLKEQ